MNSVVNKTKLRKLLNLANRGVAGEAANARSLLDAALKEHGISLSDLETEEKVMSWFRVKPVPFGKELFYQTVAAVCGLSAPTYKHFSRRNLKGVRATAAEHVEIELRYDAYCNAWDKELGRCYRAFVQANKIFHHEAPADDGSEIDPAELAKLIAMAGAMDRVELHKQLEVNRG